LLICRLGLWHEFICTFDPVVFYVSSPLDQFLIKNLATYHTRKGYPLTIIFSDSFYDKIPKLSVDPSGQARGMNPLASSLEAQVLEQAPFSTHYAIIRR